jgi:hypothetical protein
MGVTYSTKGVGEKCVLLVGKCEVKRPLGRHGHKWRIILNWILNTWGVNEWTGFIGSV